MCNHVKKIPDAVAVGIVDSSWTICSNLFMIVHERQHRILEFLQQRPSSSVTQLLEQLEISRSTLRRDLLELEEQGHIEFRPPSAKEKKLLMDAARQTLNKDKRINIRVSSRDLASLQRQANRYGMPYQTLVTSILHRYVSGDIQLTETRTNRER